MCHVKCTNGHKSHTDKWKCVKIKGCPRQNFIKNGNPIFPIQVCHVKCTNGHKSHTNKWKCVKIKGCPRQNFLEMATRFFHSTKCATWNARMDTNHTRTNENVSKSRVPTSKFPRNGNPIFPLHKLCHVKCTIDPKSRPNTWKMCQTRGLLTWKLHVNRQYYRFPRSKQYPSRHSWHNSVSECVAFQFTGMCSHIAISVFQQGFRPFSSHFWQQAELPQLTGW